MKRILLSVFTFAMLFALPEMKAQTWVPHYVDGMRTARPSPTYVRDFQRSFKSNLKHIDESLYWHIKIDDTVSYLFDREGFFRYFGEVRQSSGGKFFPSGEGIDRTMVINDKTGAAEIRYSIGTWKRGSRHGEFLVKLPNGSYCTETWRWDRRRNVSWAAPTPEEAARLEEAVARFENLLKLTE